MTCNLHGILALARNRLLLLLLASLFASPAYAACDVTAWTFGMSPEQVAGVTECGPYKTFKNGDLETYQGEFLGSQENFQFYFADQQLRRISVHLYEGQDATAAGAAWLRLHGSLSKLFGEVETPGNESPAEGAAAAAAFEAKAIEIMRERGKTQMAPITQPSDAAVFASYAHHEVLGKDYYVVVLYFDRKATP